MTEDFIDACVWLRFLFGEDPATTEYVHTLGMKRKRKGVTSQLVIGEVISKLVLDPLSKDPEKDHFNRRIFTELFIDTLRKHIKKDHLRITQYRKELFDVSLFSALREISNTLDEDDAMHLVAALKEGCSQFLTTDKALLEDEVLRLHLKRKNLKLASIC